MPEHIHRNRDRNRDNSSHSNSTPSSNWDPSTSFETPKTRKIQDLSSLPEEIEKEGHFGYNAGEIGSYTPKSPEISSNESEISLKEAQSPANHSPDTNQSPEISSNESEISLKEAQSPANHSPDTNQSQEIPNPDSEAETIQRQPETSAPKPEKKLSPVIGNLIDIRISAPHSTETETPIQPKFNLFGEKNGYESPSISSSSGNPVLNRLNLFREAELDSKNTLQSQESNQTEGLEPQSEKTAKLLPTQEIPNPPAPTEPNSENNIQRKERETNKLNLVKSSPEIQEPPPTQTNQLSRNTARSIQNKLKIGTNNTLQAKEDEKKRDEKAGFTDRVGYVIEAAKQMPNHFMGQLSEEVLGMNLSEPLPFERTEAACAKCDIPNGATESNIGQVAGENNEAAALLKKTEFTENDIAVDEVAPFEAESELVEKIPDGGEIEFGESNNPANSMAAIKAEIAGTELGDSQITNSLRETGGCCDDAKTTEAKLQEMMAQKVEGVAGGEKQAEAAHQTSIPDSMKTIGPLTVGQRARYMSHQMIQGVKQWFSANWGKLLAGAIAALTAFIGLNILTGGAITAALPALMQVIGVVMGGVALANIAGHIRNYLSQGWDGEIEKSAQSLARGLAAGAVELVFALLFNAGAVIKAFKSGFKGTTKAAAGAAKETVKTTVKSIKELGEISAKGAKTAFNNGKIMLKGVKSGFARGANSIDELASSLVNKLRFKKFKIRRQGERIQLLGEINPWILLADGNIENVSFKGEGRKQIGDRVTHEGQDAIVIGIRNEESAIVKELKQELPEFRNTTYKAFGEKGLKNLATKANKLPKTTDEWIQWATENPGKVKGLNVQGIVEEYGNTYPEAVNKFLTGWFAGKYTRNLSNAGHVGDLNSLGIPKEVLENIANDSQLSELALMLRPSNAAHATATRQRTLPKPGTIHIKVPEGTSMKVKDLAKNAGPSPNKKTGFLEVKIEINGEYQKFAFVEDNDGAIRLLPSEQATGLKPATSDKLENNTNLIPLPEGNVTTSISSKYTPPVSTSLGDKARGLVGTSLYKDGKEIKYWAVSPDQGKTYYLEEAKNLLDEQGNLRTDLNVMVVGSDIDLLAVLSPNGELNNIADIQQIASQHPETFNALLKAFSTDRPGVNPLTMEGATFQFPTAATDIQHGAQVPYLTDELLKKAAPDVKPEELKQMSRQELQKYITEYRTEVGEGNFLQEVENILGIGDGKIALTIKGKNYTIPLRDVPMLYKLLGHEFPIAAYLPIKTAKSTN
ncbi:MAG TPA: hypothetical protein DEG17_16205 [Cyanobacteria bacterium UBA11149]|nr:hypothetical protein [Cyanobacteria bacterium UBA11367]HBE60996.1 hypothetical protein [Cyanobacteria bacterium UBA11366]HBK62641.1 hypothetical protein [Cyanobacteria bacterium UBA11166]HBR77188.1 hypothetical protein [Cyanobacteria bacterium UBA11159]HBS71167.1 hypothetical protein [Cyanobacteria bacterium UBA11153]HBW90368.1 hypothetical protein [Cyanobacteria bacterium UBA11149]HCA95618.1 hypothetical protein [Cyanobacteria bacterium UBA9226]